MTPEEKRIWIAQKCGWRCEKEGDSFIWYNQNGELMGGAYREFFNGLPDYPADLNACAEMEKVLTEEQYKIYALRLGPLTTQRVREYISASPDKRCDAFIYAMGGTP